MRDRNCILLAVTLAAVSKDVCGLSVSVFIMVPEGEDCSSLICFTTNHLPLIGLAGHTAQDYAYVSSFIKHRPHLHLHHTSQHSYQSRDKQRRKVTAMRGGDRIQWFSSETNVLALGPVTYRSPFAQQCFPLLHLAGTRSWLFLSMNSKCSSNTVKRRKK